MATGTASTTTDPAATHRLVPESVLHAILATLFVLGIAAIIQNVMVGIYLYRNGFDIHPAPAPAPAHAVDARFVKIGESYRTALGKAYAKAWGDGATMLDSGQPLSTAIAAVGKSWEANRSQAFDQAATPEFEKIIPATTKDADITPAQRSAMAAAWRGFAAGLSK